MSLSLITELKHKIKLLEAEADILAEQERIRIQNLQLDIERRNSVRLKRGRIPRSKPLTDDGSELIEIQNLIKEIEDNIKNEKVNRKKAKKENNEIFFHPIKNSIVDTKIAIELVKTNPQEAREIFVNNYENWPGNSDYHLNLAKFYYENNEKLKAIDMLVSFLERNSEHNYYFNLIGEFLNFNLEKYGGENEGIKFYIKDGYIHIEEKSSVEDFRLPFNYRVPLDMNIQPYDKLPIEGRIEALEYQFLIQTNTNVSLIHNLEVCLPLKYLEDFINFFIGDLKNNNISFDYLINLDRINLTTYVNEVKIKSLKNTRSYYDDAIYEVESIEKQTEFIVPFIMLQLEDTNKRDFIEGFKRFVTHYVLPQKNLKQLLNDKKKEYKKEEDNLTLDSIREGEMYDRLAEDHGKEMAILFINTNAVPYANLVVMLNNSMNNVHPVTTHNEPVFNSAFNLYLDKFGEKYKQYKKYLDKKPGGKIDDKLYKNEHKKMIKNSILEMMKDSERKSEIDKEWTTIIETYKDKDNLKCMVSMRKTLEILSYAHSKLLGKTFESKLDLHSQFEHLDNFIREDKISKSIDEIRSYANQKVHYYRPDERKFTDTNKVSREEMYTKYVEVISYYVINIGI